MKLPEKISKNKGYKIGFFTSLSVVILILFYVTLYLFTRSYLGPQTNFFTFSKRVALVSLSTGSRNSLIKLGVNPKMLPDLVLLTGIPTFVVPLGADNQIGINADGSTEYKLSGKVRGEAVHELDGYYYLPFESYSGQEFRIKIDPQGTLMIWNKDLVDEREDLQDLVLQESCDTACIVPGSYELFKRGEQVMVVYQIEVSGKDYLQGEKMVKTLVGKVPRVIIIY